MMERIWKNGGIRTAAFVLAAVFLLTGCKGKEPAETPPVKSPVTPPAQSAAPQNTAGARSSAVGFYLDTVVTVEAYDAPESLLQEALTETARYEKLLSKTMEGSDVWRINHANGAPVEVDAHTIRILEMAQQVSSLSEGRFDVSIAPAVALWDFTGNSAVLPEEAALQAAIAATDYTKLRIDGNTVTAPANMRIDLGAIAKGYIADMVADFLKDKGVRSALLNFGGNVVVIGEKPDGTPFNIGVQDPDKTRNISLGVLQARDISVVTSGIYERGFDLEGVRYHHILDTETGMPVQNELASITIVTERSHLADALSTACFALGYEKALLLLKQFENTEAIFINRDRTIQITDGLIGKFTLLANP